MAPSVSHSRIAQLLLVFFSMFLMPAAQAEKFNKIASWPGYTRGESYDLQIQNGVAYVAMNTGGLCTVDVSNPAQPAILARLDLPGHARTIKIADDGFAYLGCSDGGLAIVNIANPAAPVIL